MAWRLGNPGCGLGKIVGDVGIDRIAVVQPQRRDSAGEIERHGPQRAGSITRACCVGGLFEHLDAPGGRW
ncbi:MAG: hypothetical protein Q8M18_14595 [Bradyrhizobium sp.]|nr:hypothetical protein [Bradyrhizobium sp.]